MRISDWSSDVCSSDLRSGDGYAGRRGTHRRDIGRPPHPGRCGSSSAALHRADRADAARSEEHTSELQSLMRISYAVFCLKKKKKYKQTIIRSTTIHQLTPTSIYIAKTH